MSAAESCCETSALAGDYRTPVPERHAFDAAVRATFHDHYVCDVFFHKRFSHNRLDRSFATFRGSLCCINPCIIYCSKPSAQMRLILLLNLIVAVNSFNVGSLICRSSSSWRARSLRQSTEATTATTDSITSSASENESNRSIDPKEAVKLFGRLAEKYIMLDSTGGLCCYSACTDCEFRLPGGGYRMAEQTASRPKWIPCYEKRLSANGKEHVSKWASEIFVNVDNDQSLLPAVTKELFVERVKGLSYAPTLGGPYLTASAATIEDESAAERLFDALADGKENLTKHRIATRLKELADGEEGLSWKSFAEALGILD